MFVIESAAWARLRKRVGWRERLWGKSDCCLVRKAPIVGLVIGELS
jgi:hypothetical protein